MGKGVIRHSDFVRDMDRGAIGEDVAEEFFRKEYNVILKNVSKDCRYWDFEVDKIDESVSKYKKAAKTKLLKKFKKTFGETIEVKYDEAAARYKNFFIEIMFDEERDVAGTTTNCKADTIVWVIPQRKGRYKLFIFKRSEFVAWLIMYVLNNKKKIKLKTPSISPRARGIAIPIKEMVKSFGFLGDYNFKF